MVKVLCPAAYGLSVWAGEGEVRTRKSSGFNDNLSMLTKDTFSALEALKAASIETSAVERIRRVMAQQESFVMNQVRAMNGLDIRSKLQKDMLESINPLARQFDVQRRADSVAMREVKLALENNWQRELASQINKDWLKGLERAKDLDWTKSLVDRSFLSGTVPAQLAAYQASEAANLSKHLGTLNGLSAMVPKSAVEQMLGAARSWEHLMPTGFLSVKDLLGGFASQLHRSEWQGALAAMGSGTDLQGRVELAVEGVAGAVAAGADGTLQELLSQLVAFIQTFDPAVQLVLALLYSPLFHVLLSAVLGSICQVYVAPWLQQHKDKRAVGKKIVAQVIAEVGSPAMLSDHRFVGTETLTVRSSAWRCCINRRANERAALLIGYRPLSRTCEKTTTCPFSPRESTGSRTGPSTTRA